LKLLSRQSLTKIISAISLVVMSGFIFTESENKNGAHMLATHNYERGEKRIFCESALYFTSKTMS
jgi:hypothetical protein